MSLKIASVVPNEAPLSTDSCRVPSGGGTTRSSNRRQELEVWGSLAANTICSRKPQSGFNWEEKRNKEISRMFQVWRGGQRHLQGLPLYYSTPADTDSMLLHVLRHMMYNLLCILFLIYAGVYSLELVQGCKYIKRTAERRKKAIIHVFFPLLSTVQFRFDPKTHEMWQTGQNWWIVSSTVREGCSFCTATSPKYTPKKSDENKFFFVSSSPALHPVWPLTSDLWPRQEKNCLLKKKKHWVI